MARPSPSTKDTSNTSFSLHAFERPDRRRRQALLHAPVRLPRVGFQLCQGRMPPYRGYRAAGGLLRRGGGSRRPGRRICDALSGMMCASCTRNDSLTAATHNGRRAVAHNRQAHRRRRARVARIPGPSRRLANQLFDAGSSIGANLAESKPSYTRRELASKNAISLKESREAKYWLRVATAKSLDDKTLRAWLLQEADEFVAMLTVSVRKLQDHGNEQDEPRCWTSEILRS